MNLDEKCVLIDNEHDLDKILKTKDKVIALVYASWCPFCKRFLPVFEQYAQEERRHFVRVQDDQESIGNKYSVNIFPTILLTGKPETNVLLLKLLIRFSFNSVHLQFLIL